jgi:hypothetical protein
MPLGTLFLIVAAVLFLIAGLQGGSLVAFGLMFLALGLFLGERTIDAFRGGFGRAR